MILTPPLLLLVLLLLILNLPHPLAISLQSRRVQTSFTLLTNSTTCSKTISHTRISTFRNINPASPNATFDGFLWDTLFLDSVQCQSTLTNRLRQSTFLRPRQTSPPGVPSDAANPFFLEARDNSPRICQNFNTTFPNTYLFTDDLPTFRDRFVRDGFLDPTLEDEAERDVVYMFVIPANDQADIVGTACAYVEIDDLVSVTPQPQIPDMPACFPGKATVSTPFGCTSMRDLRIGDTVSVPNGWDTVISFTHSEHIDASFVQLETMNGTIVISEGHLLYVNRRLKRAGNVVKGDLLRRIDGDVRVDNVRFVTMSGLYAPVTRSGVIIVDGFVVSCYTDVFGHYASHALLSPVRGVSKLMLWDCGNIVDRLRHVWWGSPLVTS